MEVGDRIIINTKGKLNWADGKTGTIKSISHLQPEEPDILNIIVDGMDTTKPPFGLASVCDYEIEPITKTVEPKETDDPVNHPSHYTDGKYECIDYIEACGYATDGYIFNAVKYISRAGKKNPEKYREDIQKAIWYLNRRKASKDIKRITTKDYIQDKGLDGTLRGIALELIDRREYSLAAQVLQMELNAHEEHSSK